MLKVDFFIRLANLRLTGLNLRDGVMLPQAPFCETL